MITTLLKRFREYALSFIGDDASRNTNVKLKLAHSIRVWRECRTIARAQQFSETETLLAEITALLHDLSRFEQIRLYNTFLDSVSFDHGDRSAELAICDKWLPPALPGPWKKDITDAIRGHNKREIPAGFSAMGTFLCRTVRDGDKLDIMRIVLHHLEQPGNSAVTYGLPFQKQLTPAVLRAMQRGESPRHADMRSSTDFLAAKLMWARDLNFPCSRALWQQRNYQGKLFQHLPRTDEIRDLFLDAEAELQKARS